jgi:hypothetical protein
VTPTVEAILQIPVPLVVRPLTDRRWGDLEAVFNAKGCSVARGCWCMYYRVSGKDAYARPSDGQRCRSKEALKLSSLKTRRPASSATSARRR